MQEWVDPSSTGVINGVQGSLCNLFYVLGFLLNIIYSDPADFIYPCLISFFLILGAAVIYLYFYVKYKWRKSRAHELTHVASMLPTTDVEGLDSLELEGLEGSSSRHSHGTGVKSGSSGERDQQHEGLIFSDEHFSDSQSKFLSFEYIYNIINKIYIYTIMHIYTCSCMCE